MKPDIDRILMLSTDDDLKALLVAADALSAILPAHSFHVERPKTETLWEYDFDESYAQTTRITLALRCGADASVRLFKDGRVVLVTERGYYRRASSAVLDGAEIVLGDFIKDFDRVRAALMPAVEKEIARIRAFVNGP